LKRQSSKSSHYRDFSTSRRKLNRLLNRCRRSLRSIVPPNDLMDIYRSGQVFEEVSEFSLWRYRRPPLRRAARHRENVAPVGGAAADESDVGRDTQLCPWCGNPVIQAPQRWSARRRPVGSRTPELVRHAWNCSLEGGGRGLSRSRCSSTGAACEHTSLARLGDAARRQGKQQRAMKLNVEDEPGVGSNITFLDTELRIW
jgi:hypothetical protein